MSVFVRLFRGLLGFGLILIMVVGAAVMATQTAWFRARLRDYLVRKANEHLNGQLTIGQLDGPLLGRVELRDVALSTGGRPVVSVKHIEVRYDILELTARRWHFEAVQLDDPVVYFIRQGDGWSIGHFIKRDQDNGRPGSPAPTSITRIAVSNGSVRFENPLGAPTLALSRRFDQMNGHVGFRYERSRFSLDFTDLSFHGAEPSLDVQAITGGLVVSHDDLEFRTFQVRTPRSAFALNGALHNYLVKPVFALEVRANPLTLPEVAAIVPALTIFAVQPEFEAKLAGPLDRFDVQADLRSSAGSVRGHLLLDALDPRQSATSKLDLSHFDLARIFTVPLPMSDVTGHFTSDVRGRSIVDLASLTGVMTLDASRAVVAGYAAEHLRAKLTLQGTRQVQITGRATAYGGTASAEGTIGLPEDGNRLDFAVSGHVGHADLSRLPTGLGLPPAMTDINGPYRLTFTQPGIIAAQLQFEESDVPGGHIVGGSTAAVTAHDAGSVWAINTYQGDVTASRVNLMRLGQAFAIPSLASSRYRSELDAHVQVAGSGTTWQTVDVHANGDVTNAPLFGGHLSHMAFDTALTADTVRVNARGMFADVDLSVVTGHAQLQAPLAGTFDGEAVLMHPADGFSLDRLDGTTMVTAHASRIGGLPIDKASLTASLHEQVLNVQTLDLSGSDLTAQGSGTIALTSGAASNFHLHAESSSLAALGTLIHQPVDGVAVVDATITGNRIGLHTAGQFTGNHVSYGNNGALTLSGEYALDLPQLSLSDAAVTATTTGTLVTVAGQHINELTAKTRYVHHQLDVDLMASQPERSLSATGSLLFHPDQQELRLTKLDLTARNLHWQLAPDTETTVRYGGGQLDVRDARLVSGNQTMMADGALGIPERPLTVTVTHFDLPDVDAALLRMPQFTGTLNGSATVRGTTSAPEVAGDFEVDQGGFQHFRYQTLKGTVGYRGSAFTIDSRLEQNATNWVRVNGTAPMRLVWPSWPGGRDGDRVDLHVETSTIDLGVVQGLTTALTNVTGTLEAKVDITGVASKPVAGGTVTLVNGAFNVRPTGVKYAHLNGRFELQNDRLHIVDFTVLDSANASLSLTGDLPIRRTPEADVGLQVTARDFKVIDNNMGNLRLNSDLSVGGELRAPRISGDLALSTGTIKLDPILAGTEESPYAMKPTEYTVVPLSTGARPTATPAIIPVPTTEGVTAAAPAPAASSAPAFSLGSGSEALQMDVRVTMPNDLIVQANDLRASGAIIGLGSLNATLGGDVRVTKQPNQAMRFTGTVNTVRGTYQFQGRQFTILRDGLVRFEGTADIDPTLDVKTQRVIQGVQTNVTVLGTLHNPRIELTSVPPLDQADILSLIVFNQPVNQLGEGQQVTLGQRAQQMAVGAIAAELSPSLGNLLTVSEFGIETAPTTGATAQLTVGEQVGKNLYVKLQQGVGDVSTTNFILEYAFTDWLRLETNLLQAAAAQQLLFQTVQDSGFDLIFSFTF